MFQAEPGLDAERVVVGVAVGIVTHKAGEVRVFVCRDESHAPHLPCRSMGPGESAEQSAAALVEHVVGVKVSLGAGSSGFATLVASGSLSHPDNLADGHRVVYLLYGVLLEEEVVGKGEWVSLTELYCSDQDTAAVACDIARGL